MLKKLIQAGFVWGIGWYFFGATEAIIKVITQPIPHLSSVLLTILSYALFGAVAGMLFAAAQSLVMLLWPAPKNSRYSEHLTYAGFIFSLLLVIGLIFLNKKLLVVSTLPVITAVNLCFCFFCAAIYSVLKRVFSKLPQKRTYIFFIALCTGLYTFLLLGLYINEALLLGKFSDLSLQRLLVNGAIVAGSIALFFIVYSLLRLFKRVVTILHLPHRVAALVILLISLSECMAYLVNQTNRTDFFNELVTILKQRPNIFIITLDTTRADHLSCYGYHLKTTPQVDRLAQESLVFSRAYAPSSWTLPSHASLFTGCYPSMHRADRAENTPPPYFCRKLSSKNLTIAELLSQHGYRTFGVIAGALCSSKFGLGQGFAYFNDALSKRGERSAAEVTDIVLSWLQKERERLNQQGFLLFNVTLPMFGFIHYYDPHHPYRPPPPYDTMFPGRNDSLILRYGDKKEATYLGQEWQLLTDIIKGKQVLTPALKQHLLSQYDGEIAYMDSHAGRVLDALRAHRLFDKSMIIVTADHGEFFGEHNLALHGMALYEEVLKVPLIIKYPALLHKTGKADYLVSLVDIVPEILKTISIPLPKNVQGAPLDVPDKKIIAEHVQDPTWKNRPEYKHIARDLRAIYYGNYKYIWASDGKRELYDIISDPHEQKNLITANDKQALEMERDLEQWAKSFQPVRGDDDSVKPDKAVIDQLRGLGYIE